MKKYKVVSSPDASRDFQKYMDYIIYTCHSPQTALKHTKIFINTLKVLEKNAEIFRGFRKCNEVLENNLLNSKFLRTFVASKKINV